MAVKAADLEAELVDTVCARIRQRLSDDQVRPAERFVRQYYRWVPAEDLRDRSTLDLYGAAIAHWNLAQQRARGEAKVHVYNPDFEHDGWQSPHTVVEIVSDDMPFIVDSVTMELTRQGYGLDQVIHPVIWMRRDESGRLLDVLEHRPGADDAGVLTESVLHVEIGRQSDRSRIGRLREQIERVLEQVRAAVEDWSPMRERALALIDELDGRAAAGRRARGCRDHGVPGVAGRRPLHVPRLPGVRPGTRARRGGSPGCAPTRDSGSCGGRPSSRTRSSAPGQLALADEPYSLLLTKANSRATVHRPAYMDYIGVKKYDAERRVDRRAPVPRPVHDSRPQGRRPRDPDRSAATWTRYCGAPASPPTATTPRRCSRSSSPTRGSRCSRWTSTTCSRSRWGSSGWASASGSGCSSDATRSSGSPSAWCASRATDSTPRTGSAWRGSSWRRSTAGTSTGRCSSRSRCSSASTTSSTPPTGFRPPTTSREIESKLIHATRAWTDDLREALIEEHGEEQGSRLYERYARAFPPGYSVDWVARSAVIDINRIEQLESRGEPIMSLYRPLEAPTGIVRCKLFSAAGVSLSDVLPTLENMGARVVDERPYEIEPEGCDSVWIYDFGLRIRERQRRSGAGVVPGRLPRRVAWRARGRRPQRAGARGRPQWPADHGDPRHRQVPAPGRNRVLGRVHGAHAAPARGHRDAAGRPVRRPLRSGPARSGHAPS